jgi:crooked neck
MSRTLPSLHMDFNGVLMPPAATPIQHTMEQLPREQDASTATLKHAVSDVEERLEYQSRQRTHFSNKLKRNPLQMTDWIRYAKWELKQKEFSRYDP